LVNTVPLFFFSFFSTKNQYVYEKDSKRMSPMYKRAKYTLCLEALILDTIYKTQKFQVFVTNKPDTLTIQQSQKIELIILK